MSTTLFSRKLVLITGASSGIGLALARRLAAEGAVLALASRRIDEETTAQVVNHGASGAAPFPCDLSHGHEAEQLMSRVTRHFGRPVEMLINAAAIPILGNAEDVPMQKIHESFEVNFFAAVALCRAVIPEMKQRRSGYIVNITSGAAYRGLPVAFPYCASKAALLSFSESLDVELSPYGVRVLTVSPGPVDTRFYANQEIFGQPGELFAPRHRRTPERAAEGILRGLRRNRTRLDLSWRGSLARHLNYWAPGLFDRMLMRKIKRPS